MATRKQIIRGAIKRQVKQGRPPIFGGPKDGRPVVRKHRGGKRHGPIFGGRKDGRRPAPPTRKF